ncbi:hypothetical protein CPC08DRAFT_790765 [Agrocybe pediades]|nr:hypothetical protein CPC08DRAFT_790765 [Agrocybe pediades]
MSQNYRQFHSSLVKAEPEDGTLPTNDLRDRYSQSTHVKYEHDDSFARMYADRGLSVPPYAQNLNRNLENSLLNGLAVKQEEQKVEIPKYFTVYKNAHDINYNPEALLKEGLGMVKTVKETLSQLELGSKLREEVWDREIKTLEGQGVPKTLIAVCGATGAGKSSILNAVLDDNIVPTSGMRACTAVVTEIAYHDKPTIDADISFLSEKEWRDELDVLLRDLVDEEKNVKRITDLNSDAGVAWSKVHAVYPKITQEELGRMDVNQIINYDRQIFQILGSTKTITAKDSQAFAKEISKFIDSKNQKRGKKDKAEKPKPKEPSLMDRVRNLVGMGGSSKSKEQNDADTAAFWPLIRQVNVRCRSEALSTGAILVDLPGVADANAARNSIAKDYMKKCNCIWILAPITRAVDDKTARDLLGDAFRIQLMSNYDDHAITFIATKCDDVSCQEIIPALDLGDDPDLEEIQDRLDDLAREIKASKKAKRDAEILKKSIEKNMKGIREQIKEDENHLQALEDGEEFVPTIKKSKKRTPKGKKRKNTSGGRKGSPKRRRNAMDSEDDEEDEEEISEESESDSDVSDEDSAEESDRSDEDKDSDSEGSADDDVTMDESVTIEELKRRIKDSKASIKTMRESLNDVRTAKKAAMDSLTSLEKNRAKVQKEKNAFCSLKRSEFSRDVLKNDFRAGLKDLDDAEAERRDPDNFNPNVNLRDYDAINLPVFTCSSRDYVRLKGQVKGDGKPTCFSNVHDTGIPDLQKWCHKLTIASRERSARAFMTQIQTFAQSVKSYVLGIGDVTANDREDLRARWESSETRHALQDNQNHLNVHPLNGLLTGLGGGLGSGLYSVNEPQIKEQEDGNMKGVTPRLCMEFVKLVDGCASDLQKVFKDGLEDKCRTGAASAAESAIPTIDEFQASMHWATYRATLRRHGSFRRDLNVELVNPFTRNIAHSWSKVFESDLFAPFLQSTIAAITSLVKEVEESAAPGLKDRARMQGEACIAEARVALNNAVQLVKETMNREQKEVSRCMAPHVQAQLIDGYDTAMEERGTGSVARQKAYFRRYISECKDHIFDDGADILLSRLAQVSEAIGETLDEAMGQLAKKVEVSLSVLWEGARDSPAQRRSRANVIDIVGTVQEQIKFWIEADNARQQEEATA